MRSENKKSKKQSDRKNISDRSSRKQNLRNTPGRGLIGEHDLGDAAERKIGRTPHDKTSVTGSDDDGQTE